MNVIIGLINGMITGATPILLAALGGTMTYYAGIFNIAMEGMMLGGAFFAVLGSYYFESWVVGILFAILGSLLMALIFILFSVKLKTDEFVTGVALNLFALGATTYMLRQIFGVKGAFASPGIVPIPDIDIPLLEDIPVLGQILSGHNLLVYVGLIATILCHYLIYKTRFGLRLRAAGYNTNCLDTSGVRSDRIRTISVILCGIFCGLAGSFLSLGYVTLFSENMSAGKGWISLAAIILVNGNPWGIALISLIFGFSDGLGLLLQQYLPSQFTSMVPYIATLIALYVYSSRKKKEKFS
ncbi:MAG TPA: ABC transporter permease [Anaerolineaceae bacterium]|uniref:Putative ABC transporter permease protein n=1 Tax=Anaerolinea thermophila TaxID=167964 RepID=A0A101FY66_9CHLR|nr:MAG: Putative ABC transporter permease protein [Anaerolinea thermophila]HAF62108.1 ABC transporter permease [Anaerolineaceae bacterium]